MSAIRHPVIAGFCVLLAAALVFAFLPLVLKRDAVAPGTASPGAVTAVPIERLSPPDGAAEDATSAGGARGTPRYSLFTDGPGTMPAATTGKATPFAASAPRMIDGLVNRPGGLFSAGPEGR